MPTIRTSEQAHDHALKRWHRPDVVDQRVDKLAEHIRRFVESAPPLTPEQADKLAAILRPAGEAEQA